MKRLLIIISIFFLSQAAQGQLWKTRRIEAGGGPGSTQFYGDIGGYSNNKNILGLRDFTFKQTRINVNGYVRYRILEEVAVRFNIAAGIFHSTDTRGSNILRGFEETTDFIETSVLAEYYFIKNKEENSFTFLQGRYNNDVLKSIFASLDFYAFAGIGGLAYKVHPDNILEPLATGTGGFTAVVPLGVGVTLIYDRNINFGLEFGGRFTYSDNIDGYTSPRSQANDIYHFLNVSVTYKFNTAGKGLAKF